MSEKEKRQLKVRCVGIAENGETITEYLWSDGTTSYSGMMYGNIHAGSNQYDKLPKMKRVLLGHWVTIEPYE